MKVNTPYDIMFNLIKHNIEPVGGISTKPSVMVKRMLFNLFEVVI